AGHLVEQRSDLTFEDYQRTRVLGPLGMTNSYWRRADLPKNRLVVSHL
ncbi:MAG TPA: serine hydrolase, partial [Verrucomicrobiales bacterium]|nr:serine hydrolase [Verrucomicrobiales bacterium]